MQWSPARWSSHLAGDLPASAVYLIDRTPIALLHLAEVDEWNHRAAARFWAAPGVAESVAAADVLSSWLDTVWREWPLVKLTVESIGDESLAPGAMSACFAPEGVLREHTWASGGWEHVTLWAACRDDWLLPASGRATAPQRLVDAMRRGREAVGRESPVSRNAGQGSAGPRPHRAGSSAELRGHRTSLRAVTNRDLPFLHSLAAGPASSQLGRGSLMLPSEALFERWWRGANTVDLIVEDDDGQPIGGVYLYGVEPLDRRANLGCAFLRETWGTFPVVDALHTAVRYAFGPLGLRKLGVEIPEWNLDRLRSGIGRLLTVEAVRRDHLYRDGRYRYQVVAALTPDVVVNRDRRRARGRGAQAVTGAEPATPGATFGQPTSRS